MVSVETSLPGLPEGSALSPPEPMMGRKGSSVCVECASLPKHRPGGVGGAGPRLRPVLRRTRLPSIQRARGRLAPHSRLLRTLGGQRRPAAAAEAARRGPGGGRGRRCTPASHEATCRYRLPLGAAPLTGPGRPLHPRASRGRDSGLGAEPSDPLGAGAWGEWVGDPGTLPPGRPNERTSFSSASFIQPTLCVWLQLSTGRVLGADPAGDREF